MNESEHEPLISLPEVILVGMLFVLFDAIELILFFFGLDDFWIMDITISTVFFYFFMKGVPPMIQLISWVIELFPYVGVLPLLSIGWFLTVWADRHPGSFLAQIGAVALRFKGSGAATAAKAPAVRGVGAQSFRRMERAEKAANARVERIRSSKTQGGENTFDDSLKEVRKPMEELPDPQLEV
jgi:hypothetical protein